LENTSSSSYSEAGKYFIGLEREARLAGSCGVVDHGLSNRD
jgi:hypothetical protein